MRINVRSEGFQLTPQLRGVVVSRLLSAVGPFGAYIELVDVCLQASSGHAQLDTTICDIAVSLRPSGDVRARGEDAHMPVAIDRAAEHIRSAVEREVSRLQAAPGAPHAEGAGPDTLELVLDDNKISQHQREWLERPANYLRPVRVREYWRPPRVEDDEVPKELEPVLTAPR
jgi:ribosome-associated translation inhibitor RaiA